MKKTIFFISILFFTSLTYSEVVRFATGEWAPFTSEKMENYGYVTELVTAICKEAGITPVYEFYPWARAEHVVEEGECFAAFPYVITEDRKLRYNFSNNLFFGETVFMYYSGNSNITNKILASKTLDEIKELKFGQVLGGFSKEDLKSLKINFIETKETSQLIQMLMTGRVDIVIGSKTVLYYSITNMFKDEVKSFKTLKIPYGENLSNHLIVSKKYKNSDDILKRFNEGLKRIKANGIYDKIVIKNHINKS